MKNSTYTKFLFLMVLVSISGTLAEEGPLVDIQPLGAMVTLNPDGSRSLRLEYSISTSDVLVARSFDIQISQIRGGTLIAQQFLSVSFGLGGDGTNCSSGGNFCSGTCRVIVDGKDTQGTCSHKGDDGNGYVCACDTQSTGKTNPLPGVMAGDVFSISLDPLSQLVETDETNNQLIISF